MKKLYSLVFILFLTPTCLYAQNGWNQIYNFENLNVFSITFKDSLTGFATSFASKIYKTTNGGKSWNEINIQQLNKPINKLNVVNNNFIFGIGDAGTVARSFDGGDLWKVDNIGDSSLSSCCGTSNGNLFICSFSGIIYKSGTNKFYQLPDHFPPYFGIPDALKNLSSFITFLYSSFLVRSVYPCELK